MLHSFLSLSFIILILRWMMRSQNSTPAEMKSNDGDILSCQFFNTTTSTILLPIIPSPKLRLELLKLLLLMKWTTFLSQGGAPLIFLFRKIKLQLGRIIQMLSKYFRNILEIIFFYNFLDQPIHCLNFLFHLSISPSFRFHVG